MDPAALLREQLDALNGGISHAMVTIVEADGSTPRKNGKMLVFENGDTLGTIGGGSAECLAAKDAMECIRTGENAFKIYDLSSAATNNTGMTCGGHIKVLIESFPSKPLLVMCGAGHVGCAVLKVAGFMGYSTLLIDDRADEVIDKSIAVADRFVRVKDFEKDITEMDIPAGAFIVIATHGHINDRASLYAALAKKAAYIGMIGSRRKIAGLFEYMRNRGVTDEQLDTVFTPIGLDIGGDTPEEIAVAIMAEVQSSRYHGRSCRHLRELRDQ